MEAKDVLHLYIGAEMECINKECNSDTEYFGMVRNLSHLLFDKYLNGNWKIRLRKLSDMTEEEKVVMHDTLWITKEEDKHYSVSHKCTYWHLKCSSREKEPEILLYLLKQGFDLFNLIESSQAIDKETLTTKK